MCLTVGEPRNIWLINFSSLIYDDFSDWRCSPLFFHGTTAFSGSGLRHYRGLTIILRHTIHSLVLLWTNDSPSQRPLPDNTQHSQETDLYASGGIRTSNPSKRATANRSLRPRGHWDRPIPLLRLHIYIITGCNT